MSFALYTAALLPVAALGASLVAADDNRMVQQDGLIRYPVVPKLGAPLFGKHSNLTKRQLDTDSLAQRSGTLYTIEIGLGTPGQTVPVQFDTGSSELWVNPVCSKSTTPDFCNAQPRFTESSTLVDLGVQGQVVYGTGYADFEYVADYVSIGSAKITQQIFGVAFDSAHAVVGLMGAGPSLYGWSPADNGYPLIIDSLAEQGLTNSRAFSMDLKGFDSARGSVIFGGIDVKKYSGSLVKLPIIPAAQSPDGLTRFWVHANGISVNQPDGNVVSVYNTPAGSKGQPFLLDSGYTLSALPTAIFQKLLSAFPSAEYVPSAELYVVDCLEPDQGGSLDFTFGDKVINVRYFDFVWHYPDTDACVLGAFEDNEFPVLGDTFLRSAYVVYDWDNREISLGQSDDCGSKLVPIGKGPNAVPNLPGECGQTTPTSTSTSSEPASTSSTSSTSTSVSETSTSSDATSSSTITSTVSESFTVSESTSSTVSESTASTASESSTTSGSSSSGSTSLSTATSTSTTEPGASSTEHSSTTTQPTITRSTITYSSYTTYTITSCPPTVTHCPLNHVTTEIVTVTTAICPETTGTYTIHKTITCSADDSDSDCARGSTKTTAATVTLSPLAPTERTTHVVPGCTPGATGPSVCAQCGTGPGQSTTMAVVVPTASAVAAPTAKCPGPSCGGGQSGNGTATAAATAKPTQSGVVTAGAAKVGMMQGLAGLAVAGLVMAVMGL